MDALYILRSMAHNNAWANHRLHHSIAALHPTQVQAQRISFFPSLHLTLNHILFVDLYYVGGLTNRPEGAEGNVTELPQFWAELSRWNAEKGFADIASAQRTADRRLVDFVAGLGSDADLDIQVRLPRRDHVQLERRGDVLLHLFQHQVHHRGQAHAMLSGTSVKPPQLDDFFLAGDLPLRKDELLELGLPLHA